MRVKLNYPLLEEEKGTPPAGGTSPTGEAPKPGGGEAPKGAEAPASASADASEEGEAPEPVLDNFLDSAKEKGEQPPKGEKPADEKPAAQPPAPPAAPPKGEEAPKPQPPSTPAKVEQPAAPPPATPQQPPQAPAQPAAQPAPQPPQQPPAQPQQPPAQSQQPQQPPAQPTAEQLEQQRQEQRNAYLAQMEQTFAISPEDRDALIAEPEKVLPKLAARVHVAAVEATIGAFQQMVTPMVLRVLEQQKVSNQSEEQFYSKWPKLNTPEGKAEASRLMQNYVQLNKDRGITREQAINDVGLLAHAALRIPLDIPGQPPAQPQAPAPNSPPPPPAQPGAAGGTVRAPTPSVWDKVDQELFTEDSS